MVGMEKDLRGVRKEQAYYSASARYKIKLVACRMPFLEVFPFSELKCLPAHSKVFLPNSKI